MTRTPFLLLLAATFLLPVAAEAGKKAKKKKHQVDMDAVHEDEVLDEDKNRKAPVAYSAAPSSDERTGLIRRNDRQLTLVGPTVAVGDAAPVQPLWGASIEEVAVDFDDGNVRVVLFVPSVDTPTCSMQTRTFNTRATELGGGTEVIVVSRDLPYAQQRFCAANGIEMVSPLSDFKTGAFGQSWGLLVKETGLLARAVAIVDGAGKVAYLQIVENLPDEPDYDAALAAATELTSK